MKLETLIAEWKDYQEKRQDLRPYTIKQYAGYLQRFLKAHEEGLTAHDLTPRLCRVWIAEMCGSSRHMGSVGLAALKSLCKYGVREGHFVASPLTLIEPISIPQVQKEPIPDDAIEKVMAACRCLTHKAIMSLLVYAGMRVSEVADFRYSHLDTETGRVIIPDGKGGQARRVFVCSEAVAAVDCWKASLEEKGDQGFGLVACSIRHMVSRLCQRAKLDKEYSPHQFRHAYALRLLRNEVDVRVIQKSLGHKNLNTTARYLACDDEDLMKIAGLASLDAAPKKERQKQRQLDPRKREKVALPSEPQERRGAVRFDGRTKETEQNPQRRIQRLQRFRRTG